MRKKQNRPPGASTRATSAIASSTSSMCSNTRHATTASNDRVGERQRVGARARADARGRPRGRRRREIWFHVGSIPTARSTPSSASARRVIWPSPHPTSSTRRAPASSAAASGRICSSYSGSAPSVNPSIHHPALASHSSRLVTVLSVAIWSLSVTVRRSRHAPQLTVSLALGRSHRRVHRPIETSVTRSPSGRMEALVDRRGHGVGSQASACSSSSDACFTALTPPSSFTSRFLRASPRPAMPSRTLAVIRLPRSSPWNVLAKRWASSRMRCSMNSASLPRGTSTGSAVPGHVDLLEALGQPGDRDLVAPGRAVARPARPRRAGPCRRRRAAAAAGRRTCRGRRPARRRLVALGEVRGQPPGQHLLHRRVVVVARHVRP